MIRFLTLFILLYTAGNAFAGLPEWAQPYLHVSPLKKPPRYDRQLLSWCSVAIPSNAGSTTITYHNVYRVGGDGNWCDFTTSFPYQGDDFRSASGWIVSPQGKVKGLASEALTHKAYSELDLYSDEKVATWSLNNIETGSIVCLEYAIRLNRFAGCGECYFQDERWDVDSSVVEFDLPPQWTVRITPQAMDSSSYGLSNRQIRTARQKRWEEGLFSGTFPVAAARATYEVFRNPNYSPNSTWEDVSTDVAREWSKLNNGHAPLNYYLPNRLDALEAIVSRFEHDFRYVAIELGKGNYIPHKPQTVLSARYGDCKDLSLFLAAALTEAGYKVVPVLLHIPAEDPFVTEYPDRVQFNHCITAIVRASDTLYYDPTAPGYDLGALPELDQNAYALFVVPGAPLLQLPSSADRKSVRKFTGTVDSGGRVTGELEIDLSYLGQRLSAQFPTTESMQKYVRSILRKDVLVECKTTQIDEEHRTLTATLTIDDYARKLGNDIYCTLYPFRVMPDSTIESFAGGFHGPSTRTEEVSVALEFPENFLSPGDSARSMDSDIGTASLSLQGSQHRLQGTWVTQFKKPHYPRSGKRELDSLLHFINDNESMVAKMVGR